MKKDDIADRARALGKRFETEGYFQRAAAAYRMAATWYESCGQNEMRDLMGLAQTRVRMKESQRTRTGYLS